VVEAHNDDGCMPPVGGIGDPADAAREIEPKPPGSAIPATGITTNSAEAAKRGGRDRRPGGLQGIGNHPACNADLEDTENTEEERDRGRVSFL